MNDNSGKHDLTQALGKREHQYTDMLKSEYRSDSWHAYLLEQGTVVHAAIPALGK